MRRLENHLIGIEQGTAQLFSDFESGGEMWTGNGPREARVKVKFDEPFHKAPSIMLALSMFDLDQKTNQRADLTYEKVTAKGFDIVFRTWGDTRIARARASWTAIGELIHEDQWDIE